MSVAALRTISGLSEPPAVFLPGSAAHFPPRRRAWRPAAGPGLGWPRGTEVINQLADGRLGLLVAGRAAVGHRGLGNQRHHGWLVEEDSKFGKGLLRPRPVPGSPLNCDRPSNHTAHGRLGHLLRLLPPRSDVARVLPHPSRHYQTAPSAHPDMIRSPFRKPGTCSLTRPHWAPSRTGCPGGAATMPVRTGTTRDKTRP